MQYTPITLDKQIDIEDEHATSARQKENHERAAYLEGYRDGLKNVYPTVRDLSTENGRQAARIAELEAALKLAAQFLNHPDVLAITTNMALPGETLNARIDNLLKGKS